MKTKRFRILTVLLAAVMLVALSLNVYAAKSNAVTKDGLTAQLFTDKDSYKADESVNATVRVDNQTGREVFIFTSLNVPDGVTLASGSTAYDALLQDGESWTTAEGIILSAGDIAAGSTTQTGDNMQAGFWIILTALAVCGIIALFIYGKNSKTWLSVLLCLAMVGGLAVAAVPVEASDVSGSMDVSCTIQVDGKDALVSATVSYVIYDDADDEAEGSSEAVVPSEPGEDTSDGDSNTSDSDVGSDTDSNTDTDTDAEGDSSADTGTDTDTDDDSSTDTGTDTDADDDSSANTGTDTDADDDSGAGTGTDTDADDDSNTDGGSDDGTSSDVTILFRENFESPVWAGALTDPQGIFIAPSRTAHTVSRISDGDTKVLSIESTETTSTSEYQVDAKWSSNSSWSDTTATSDLSGKTIVYEFDLKPTEDSGTNLWVQLRSNNNGSGKTSTICQVADNVLVVQGDDGTDIRMTLSKDELYNIAIVVDFETKTRTVYVNGEVLTDGTNLAEDVALKSQNTFNAEAVNDLLRFNCWNKSVTSEFYLDNIQVYESDVPVELPAEDENDNGSTAQPPEVEGAKIFEADFELANPATVINHDNIIEVINDYDTTSGHGQVVRFERKNEQDFHMDISGVAASADYIVYDFDVKLLNAAETWFSVQLKDSNGNYSTICRVTLNGVVNVNNQDLATISENEWHNIAVVYNYADRVRSVYVDEQLVESTIDLTIEQSFGASNIASILRFNCPPLKSLLGTTEFNVDDYNHNFMIDNVRVYEGTKPCDELVDMGDQIVFDPDVTIFDDPSIFDEQLEGYLALHGRSGLVYKDGVKTKLATLPVETEEGKYLVVAEEICEILGVTYSASGDTATINGTQATVTNMDGKLWIDAQYFFETILGKVVAADTWCKSYGMVVAGDTAFTFPLREGGGSNVFFRDSPLQDLNDYLFFERPTPEAIEEAYEASSSYEQHPRIQATASDFAALRTEITTDPLKQQWYTQILAAADFLLDNDDPLVWELRDGVRLLYVSRDMLDHMYTLGMAYQLTGEQKYVDRAWVDLYAVSNFQDWHPEHSLDPAEMAAAVAIGYDWLYEALTEAQRQIIEEGIYKNAFHDFIESYQTPYGGLTGYTSIINHNIVENGGTAMAAMAFMDVYPEECYYMTSCAIRGADIMLTEFGPDGAWFEGPAYWEYAMQYTTKMLSTLDSVFGNCFSLDRCQGLSTAADYILYMQSDNGIFNYGDGGQANFYIPELFYLSNEYDNKNITSAVLELNNGQMSDSEDLALSLLWYDTSIKADALNMALDNSYEGEGVASFRNEWTDGYTTFVGIQGGKTVVCHSHLDAGTFVYDYAGVRWATELGGAPYDLSVTAKYWDARWKLYKARAESHNTIVINPDEGPDQDIGTNPESTRAELIRFESDEKGGIAVLDLSEVYASNANKAIRGFFFTDDRNSLVVRDEIQLKEDDSTVYWFMQTEAKVTIAEDKKSAILTKNDQQIRLEYLTNATNAELTVGPSVPLESSPVVEGDVYASSTNRIAIKVTGSGELNITVKLTPVGNGGSVISDYDKSIAEWKVPEGPIVAGSKPELQSAKIGEREITFDDDRRATVGCLSEEVPDVTVTVDETKFKVEMTKAEDLTGSTLIKVIDLNNEEVYVTYTVKFKYIPVPMEFDGMNSLQLVNAYASEEPEAATGYIALGAIDGDVTKYRWTSQGIGQWIIVELEEEATVDNLMIKFGNGHKRSTYFNVCYSTDGETWNQVYSGKSLGTELGDAEAFEQVVLGGVTAKYIKIECNGNTAQGAVEGWNNIIELVLTQNDTSGGDDSGDAGNGGNTEEDDNTVDPALVTPYGNIPEAYLSVDDYLFVRFAVETDGTYTFKEAAADIWGNDANNLLMMNARTEKSVIYMRKDCSGPTAFHDNLNYVPDLTIDLGDNTLSVGNVNVFYGNPKSNGGTANTVFKNGSIAIGSAPFIIFNSWNSSGSSFVFNMTFEDITFKTISGATSPHLVARFDYVTGKRSFVANVNYNDCTFDLSAGVPTGGITLFTSGNEIGTITGSVTVNGGKIIAPTAEGITFVNVQNDSSTCVFGTGSDGNYTKLTLSDEGATAPTDKFTIADGKAAFQATDTAGEYILVPVMETTPVITISTQPTNATVTVGAQSELTVTAGVTENATINYQWYSCTDANKTDATAIEGATSANYTMTTEAVGTTYYFCRISATNAESVDSNVVTVTAQPVVLYAEDFSYEGETPDWLVTWKDFYGVYIVEKGTNTPNHGGTLEAVSDDGNTVLKVDAPNTVYQVNVRWSKNAESKTTWGDNTNLVDLSQKTIVYEFDISLVEASVIQVNLRSYNSSTKLSNICAIGNNVLSFTGVTETMTLENGKWYHIAVVNDYGNGIRDIYVDNLSDSTVETWKVIGNAIPNYSNLNTKTMNDFMRFHYDSAATAKFMLDNIKVYEAEAPYDFE